MTVIGRSRKLGSPFSAIFSRERRSCVSQGTSKNAVKFQFWSRLQSLFSPDYSRFLCFSNSKILCVSCVHNIQDTHKVNNSPFIWVTFKVTFLYDN